MAHHRGPSSALPEDTTGLLANDGKSLHVAHVRPQLVWGWASCPGVCAPRAAPFLSQRFDLMFGPGGGWSPKRSAHFSRRAIRSTSDCETPMASDRRRTMSISSFERRRLMAPWRFGEVMYYNRYHNDDERARRFSAERFFAGVQLDRSLSGERRHQRRPPGRSRATVSNLTTPRSTTLNSCAMHF